MKLTTQQLKSIIREEVQKTLTARRRALRETDEFDYADDPDLSSPENQSAELDDYISHAVQDIKAGTHPVTGEPITGTIYDLAAIADDLAEGFEDGELDPKEILKMLLDAGV